MKIIYNEIIPFPGYKAIMLFGLLFVRKGATMSDADLNHEEIHLKQFKEVTQMAFLLSIPFGFIGLWWVILLSPIVYYIWYVVEWFVRLIQYRDDHQAYRNISFEREAYENERDLLYTENREDFSFLRYIHIRKF